MLTNNSLTYNKLNNKYLKYKQKYLKLKLLNKSYKEEDNNYNPATTHPASIKSI